MDYTPNEVNDRPMKPGFSLDSYVSHSSGETVYRVCDAIGVVFTTIFENDPKLERFLR
jgi:hypothetical protein